MGQSEKLMNLMFGLILSDPSKIRKFGLGMVEVRSEYYWISKNISHSYFQPLEAKWVHIPNVI